MKCGNSVGVNSINCSKFVKWLHKYSGIKGNLAKLEIFEGNMCKTNQVAADSSKSVNMAEI